MQTVPVIDPKRLEAILAMPIKSGGHNTVDEGPAIERSRQDAVDLVRAALAITE